MLSATVDSTTIFAVSGLEMYMDGNSAVDAFQIGNSFEASLPTCT
jgi:hypothetical protein